ncbi:MAG: retropepsin-like aspartic protease [Azoarcus sp.]|nr:retropepsin-like aspartic protease [Azoarcus sp.]
MRNLALLLVPLLTGLSTVAVADDFGTSIDMNAKGGATYYVPAQIGGLGAVELMVDTGSGYMTINEDILETLRTSGQVRFLRNLRGRLANGSELNVPVYLIESVSIGNACWLRDVEAAVFPGKTRPILGLNVLQRAAPFIFSFEPPRLVLSNCDSATPTNTADLAALQVE